MMLLFFISSFCKPDFESLINPRYNSIFKFEISSHHNTPKQRNFILQNLKCYEVLNFCRKISNSGPGIILRTPCCQNNQLRDDGNK